MVSRIFVFLQRTLANTKEEVFSVLHRKAFFLNFEIQSRPISGKRKNRMKERRGRRLGGGVGEIAVTAIIYKKARLNAMKIYF